MPESSTTAMAESAAAKPKARLAPHQPTSAPPSAGPLAKAMVRASSIRALAGWQQVRAHQRGHQGRCGHAVDDGAAHGSEAEQGQQRQIEGAEREQQHDRREGCGPQRLGARHQRAAGDAVGEQAGRDGEEHERKCQRHLQ
ncbi:hypothetical protein ACVME8_006102 [Bradyrhizobium diazoefficiens]